LLEGGLAQTVHLNCIGYVRYMGGAEKTVRGPAGASPMGLYGISISEGQTHLRELVQDIPLLDLVTRESSLLQPIHP
jgi:hypothetical protein